MIHGEFKGQNVSDAKDLVRKQLIDQGFAFPYSEPDGKVVSRSGGTFNVFIINGFDRSGY